ncbi:AAA family ATPase [Aliikangiella coralliicola]|uniref:AAA family ATPase n=1 Tax=Aliikangiella coralliicola TaxID=2592383 RepID=A0A545TV29_9GAMM|nr:AAA family ATPase [Aliikangiella coralliicola]TQV81072.1 AAA family ATPase [Aliikangiella coralliicola]
MRVNKTADWLASLAHDATPDINECIAYLGKYIEWLYDLKNTHQDPEWHAEGNVHIHTGMVLVELYKTLGREASHIQGVKRQALILAALLHDIGKTVRTKEVEINGVVRIACPQHEAIGRSYLAFKLMELDLPFYAIWTVLGLVGEHHMPKLLVVKNKTKGDYLSLSRRADVELLYWLEVADMRGRICSDLSTQLDYLDEFRMFAEEYDVWGKTHNLKSELLNLFANENESEKAYIYSRALYEIEKEIISLPVEAMARSFTHKARYSNLIVLCGPSGSGKSTWVQRNCEDFTLISLDKIREEINGCRANQKSKGQVLQLAKERLKACLRNKQNVVWDATNLRSDFRKILCDFGRDYNALVTLVVFLQPEGELFRNNDSRDFSVPEKVLKKQLMDFQFPLVNEAHQLCIVDGKGAILHRSGYLEFDNEI